MWLFGGVLGMLIGASAEGFDGAIVGAILGGVVGLILKLVFRSDTSEIKNHLAQLDASILKINQRLDAFEKNAYSPQAAAQFDVPETLAPAEDSFHEPEREVEINPPDWIVQAQVSQAALVQERSSSTTEPASVTDSIETPLTPTLSYNPPYVEEKPREPTWFDLALAKAKEAIRQFIFGGNTLVKVGSLILFLGLAFLLRYAAGQISVPIEMRYAGVAASALALLGFGWKLRHRRRDYALILQGLAVALLYLTIYAAMKLHPLLPPVMGFVLMVVVSATSAVLAVKQNSLALAVAGSLGGFATPVLASTGGGNHVALFSYIALLDAGIFAVAWFRAWRVLNLLGFVGTFGLFMDWFSRAWQTEYLVSAELFLLLFLAMFIGILIRFTHHLQLSAETIPSSDAERDGVLLTVSKRADYIDGTLAFGVPVVAFILHTQMVRHLEFGAAFGALGLGAIYLFLAAVLRRFTHGSYLLLIEVFIALGVVFASLAIPLGLEPQWSSAAWAMEAAGIFWIGIRQQRPLARLFALLLLIGSIVNFFRTLHFGQVDGGAVLQGSIFGCILIAASLLWIHGLLRTAPPGAVSDGERGSAWLPALAGTLMIYLLPPLLLPWEYCGAAWAGLGLLTLYLALRFVLPVCVWAGFLIQLFAGLAFLTTLHRGAGGTVLDNGYSGLFSALVIGGAMLAAAWMATAKLREAGPELAGALQAVGVVTIVGLSLLNLAFLFVLPLQSALTAWALTSTLIVAMALRMGNRVALWFAVGLELLAGLILLYQRVGLSYYSTQNLEQTLLPFQHSGWWSALVFSLSGFLGAWLLKRAERKNAPVPLSNSMLLLWGALWWVFAWTTELQRWLPGSDTLPALVIALVITQLLWWGIARWQDWAELRRFTYSHLPLAALLAVFALIKQTHPFADYGWLVWPLAAGTHFFLMRGHDRLGDEKWQTHWHIAGVWWLLLLASFELRWHFALIGDDYSAWNKLGWALVPLAYIWWAANWSRPTPWPMTRFLDAYRKQAALPVAALLGLWLFVTNFISSGAALPLPYVPVLNPLELTQIAGLLVMVQWLKMHSTLKETSFEQRIGILVYSFVCLTAGVFRAVHHWAGVPWKFDALLNSLLLQGSLSVVWSLVAGAIMLVANRRGKRGLWMVGAGLIAVVVAKLFLVELLHAGTVERIVSFIVVGILLLVLGYFAPVPPKKHQEKAAIL